MNLFLSVQKSLSDLEGDHILIDSLSSGSSPRAWEARRLDE